ncbi:MAG: DUF4338 domain-containing protein [Polyangiaceae bacterium]|nr:DUF4338 domain-containing protein [Polyangiaceae bacterium]
MRWQLREPRATDDERRNTQRNARVSDDWQQVYAHPIYFTETFVDPARYRGTCYHAANWTLVGQTLGQGKDCRDKKPNRSIRCDG